MLISIAVVTAAVGRRTKIKSKYLTGKKPPWVSFGGRFLQSRVDRDDGKPREYTTCREDFTSIVPGVSLRYFSGGGGERANRVHQKFVFSFRTKPFVVMRFHYISHKARKISDGACPLRFYLAT